MTSGRGASGGSWPVYVAAAFGFIVWGALGGDNAFLAVTLVPAMLCLVQAYFRWPFLWAVIFGFYVLGVLAYSVLLITDLVALLNHRPPSVLLDRDDSIVFVVFLALIVAVTGFLYRARPARAEKAPVV